MISTAELVVGGLLAFSLVQIGFLAGLFIGLYKTRRLVKVTYEYRPGFKLGKTEERSVNADYSNTSGGKE